VVATSAREVGRALENVAGAIEREVFGKGASPKAPPPSSRGSEGSPKTPGDVPRNGDPAGKEPHA